jgi:hypothetical protein
MGYDLPSSLMSGLGNADVEEAAQKLDATLVPFMEDLTGAAATIEQYPVRNREQASSKSYEELVAGFEAVAGDAEGGRFTGAQITLRMIIWEGPDGTGRISYDVPSTLWQHLHNNAIDAVTARLDHRLATFYESLAGHMS